MADAMDNVEDVYALSPVQEGILFHTLSTPRSGAYVEQFSCRIVGGVELGAFKAAWRRVFAKHGALRTIFLWEGLDEPLQVVRKNVELPWRVEDWREEDEEGRNQRLADYLKADRADGFDLSAAPITRMLLACETSDSWRFVWTFHHLMIDAWSLSAVFNDLHGEYAAELSGGSFTGVVPAPYSEYIAWLQNQDELAEEKYWRDQLSGLDDLPKLEFHDLATGESHAELECVVSPELCERLTDYGRSNRLTLNTIVHGAWALVLGRCVGKENLVFGSVVSGRSPKLAGVGDIVGCCINTLPFRAKIEPAETVEKWLESLQRQHVAMREHETTALSKIQKWRPVPSSDPLFDHILVFENSSLLLSDANDAGGLCLRNVELRDQSNYPLAVVAVPEEKGLRFLFIFDSSRFAESAMKRLMAQFKHVLSNIVDSSLETVADVMGLPSEEVQLLATWSAGPELSESAPLFLSQFDRCVAENPNAPSVICRGVETTYLSLNDQAEKIATQLVQAGLNLGDRVALCVERSTEMIAGILGILKAGGAYVPLDPAYPDSRLSYMAEDSGSVVLLTRRETKFRIADGVTLFFEDIADGVAVGKSCASETVSAPVADDSAYVIYTSGSTGKPKGVAITHGNLAASTQARFQYYEKPVGRFLLMSSFAFDSSVAGIFWTLASGGALVLPPEKLEQDMDALSSLIAQAQVTHTLCLPTLHDLLLRFAPREKLSSLRVVAVAGEECSAAICDRHHETLPGCELHNEYGPTEATVWCAAHKVNPQEKSSQTSIGKPIPSAQVHILNSEGKRAPVGVAGEIYVGGAGVASGYLGREAMTAERFVPSPFELPGSAASKLYRTGDLACWMPDGNLKFLGRIDQQIKIRGHRIELGEIEAALGNHAEIAEAAVIYASTMPADEVSLVAALEALDPAVAEELLNLVENE